MTPEERFRNFYSALQKSNPIWWDLILMKFGKKDLPDIAQKLLIELHAEGAVVKNMDWKQTQNRYSKMLTWASDKPDPIQQQKAEPVQIHPQALTGEAKQARLKEWLEAVNKIGNPQTERVDPYKKIREQYKAPDGMEYHKPSDDGTEYLQRMQDLRIEYARLHTDKYTGAVLEGHPTFNEFIRDL